MLKFMKKFTKNGTSYFRFDLKRAFLAMKLTFLVLLFSSFSSLANQSSSQNMAGGQKNEIEYSIKMSEKEISKISGKVTDDKGAALPGVSVVIKGTNVGAVTDANGNFTLLNVAENATLQFSFIGMKTQEVAVVGNTTINIIMKEESVGIDEVVAIGYGTQKKGNLTGSIGNVKSEELAASSNVASTTNALAGRVAGLVSLQSTGVPGYDAAALSIRGFGNALVIVDGIETDFNSIDVNQIESVSILKDGSASIYGSRAGNGVILVTTKRGKDSKPIITFNSSYTSQGVTNQPKGVSSWEFAELEREKHLNSGNPESTVPFTEEQIEKYRMGNDPNYPNTNWYDYLVRDWAPQWQHNLSVRGGSDKIKYYGFIGYLDQETMFKKNGGGYNRYNLQSNIDAKILDNLTFTLDLSSIVETKLQSASGYGPSLGAAWAAIWQSQPIYPATLPDPTKIPSNRVGGGGQGHIMTNTNGIGYNKNNAQNFKGTGILNYQFNFIKGLSAKAFVNVNQYYAKNKNFIRPYNLYYYEYTSDTYTSAGATGKAKIIINNNQSSAITQQYSLNYDRNFAEKHHLTILGLYESINYLSDYLEGRRSNFLTPAIEQMFGGDPSTMESYGSEGEMGRKSYLSRLNYSYKDKYLLETTLRADASAKFSEDNRWGYFPSISAGWVVSQESFLKNLESIDHLKIRASYGESGNDAVGNFQYLSGYQLTSYPWGGSYSFGPSGSLPTLATTGLANPNLTWEQLTIYNIGLDYSLWGRKLYGEGDVFYRSRTGIPASRLTSLPSTFGSELPPENLNSLNDRGFELSIGTEGKLGELAYNLNGNVSWSRSKWDHFEEPEYTDPDQERLYKRSGKWTDIGIGFKSDGIFTSQDEIDNLGFDQDTRGNVSLQPGDIRYVDINDDKVLDWKDQVQIGKGNVPHWMAGLNISLQYRQFDLSALFQGGFGFYTLLPSKVSETYTKEYYNERWTEQNNNKNALYPVNGGSLLNGNPSDYWYRKADYVRLKTLNIGYNIPGNLLSRLNVDQCRIYFAGQNLFTMSGLNKYHLDPEVPSGIGMYYYPQQRTITLGMNISL